MTDLGRYNRLRIVKRTDIGIFLDTDDFGEILLPRKYVLDTMRPGDDIEVFIYNDSEDRVVATTLTPRAQVGECAYLKVVGSSKFGAFLDWGLPKDLLVPFSEQQKPMQKGYSYTVYLFVDETTQRIAASTRLEDYLSMDGSGFKPRQSVDCLIYGNSDLGFNFQRLHYGEKIGAYIKRIRSDGRIDLVLQLPSQQGRDQLSEAIVSHLRQNQGVSTLTDKSPPDDIYRTFGASKANFKKALGRLYKQRRIAIEKHRITLL
jgi:predicted RNA-binding protein (virulence factor B family)